MSELPGGTSWAPDSSSPSISHDGRFVAFETLSDGFSPDDTNLMYDVYVKDRSTRTLELVSRSAFTGLSGNASSLQPSISGDGQFVAFASGANDLVPGDGNVWIDIFVYERATGQIQLVSRPNLGGSADGVSAEPSISANGRFVAFMSAATNLVPGDTNGRLDVFLHDRLGGQLTMISRDIVGGMSNGDSDQPCISSDGRYVAFRTTATDIVPGDANNAADVIVYDRITGSNERVSRYSNGSQLFGESGFPSISGDGRLVAFHTDSLIHPTDNPGSVDPVVFDVQAGSLWVASEIDIVTLANGESGLPRLSDDGEYVVFITDATNLAPGDTNGFWDIYRVRVGGGPFERVSLAHDGSEITDLVFDARISADGSHIAFMSEADGVVSGDSDGGADVFVRNLGPTFPRIRCQGKQNSAGCVPFVDFQGTPSVSSTDPFFVRSHGVVPAEAGFLIYGTSGRLNLDFHGGKLCVKLPFHRMAAKHPLVFPAGCLQRSLRVDFNKRIQGGFDPALSIGQVVNSQWIQRDPADPAGFGDSLSDALEFTIGN